MSGHQEIEWCKVECSNIQSWFMEEYHVVQWMLQICSSGMWSISTSVDIHTIYYLDIDVTFFINLHKHTLDDLLHVWKKDLDDVPSNGLPVSDWILAPPTVTESLSPLMNSDGPFICMPHALSVIPPISPRVDKVAVGIFTGWDDEESSDDDSINGEVEYCPPTGSFLVIM